MNEQQAITNLQYSLDREADLDEEAVEMAIDALENRLFEISREEMVAKLTNLPMNQGGLPKFMLDDSVMPVIDLLNKRLKLHGIRIAFLKTER